jgi:hypothetical protein
MMYTVLSYILNVSGRLDAFMAILMRETDPSTLSLAGRRAARRHEGSAESAVGYQDLYELGSPADKVMRGKVLRRLQVQ